MSNLLASSAMKQGAAASASTTGTNIIARSAGATEAAFANITAGERAAWIAEVALFASIKGREEFAKRVKV
eukprot:CAMPEP_0173120462 /NCGR_PEP_ID=MMETSP1102-20130122/52564_1 /TAXON_ID=49646 /ORGANISM="Geminigera sp., Strain Caron Lab Isolate" /LENGTH=70 /DNA_ID=CAMNT_0014026601 /DNA_START=105 /DNA_END=313 /DNA_ORIENTATION=+